LAGSSPLASDALARQYSFRLTSATKTHINDNPAYCYNYAFATVFKFQLHDYVARKILHQPPQSCNYADNKEVGAWLNNILKKGGTEDWRKVWEGGHRRGHLYARDDGLLQAAHELAGTAKQRPTNWLGLIQKAEFRIQRSV
jgi:hypothetical protein